MRRDYVWTDWTIARQREQDGLWSVFTNKPKLKPDTGGSAGLAAALAIGHAEGWLGQEGLDAAKKALEGRAKSTTPRRSGPWPPGQRLTIITGRSNGSSFESVGPERRRPVDRESLGRLESD